MKEKSNLALILGIVWAFLKWLTRRGDAKDKEVGEIQMEIAEAFKIKDKREKASRLNALVQRLNKL